MILLLVISSLPREILPEQWASEPRAKARSARFGALVNHDPFLSRAR